MRLRPYPFVLVALLTVMLAAWADAGSIVIPAWSFARGNAQIHADPAQYADAGPVVVSGDAESWGWTVEYDFEVPVEAKYTVQICYASAESRPVNVRVDSKYVGTACDRVTFSPKDPDSPTSNSSGATWDPVYWWGGKVATIWHKSLLSKGKHTIKLTRRQPLPHLLAIRIETDAEFPEGWPQPQFKVRDINSIPAKCRAALLSPDKVLAALPPPLVLPKTKPLGSLKIPAHTFDRGNANIYASPDQYVMAGTLTGNGPSASGESVVEYDIEFPVTAEYTFHVRYAAIEPRPTDVYLDGKKFGKSCVGISHHTANYVRPHKFPVNSESTKAESLYDYKQGTVLKLSIAQGKHTVKLARRGLLPHLVSLTFDSDTAFPKEWQQSERKTDLSRLPAPQRTAFLPKGAVNVAAMKLAVQDAIKTYGSRYPKGPQYLKQLSELAAKHGSEDAAPEQLQELHDEARALRREIMLAHPLLDFDKLLFLKRSSIHYSHTYSGPQGNVMGGSLCVLSPVSPDGKVTSLVPELEGGLFGRFDLSFDAKKVVFTYKKTPQGAFRLYEVDIDSQAGIMIPGSLRQLTFGGDEEDSARERQVADWLRGGFSDMYPCYLPSGKIMFSSTRAQRVVYCAPQPVTTLYVMDADGKNMRHLSENVVSETIPTMLHDGRVIYTRWEYLDKGLGGVQNLWAMRPDGRGVDHVYKLNNNWPSGMGATRAIPGSEKLVTVAGNHYQPSWGSVVLLDVRRSRRTHEAMHCITPDIPYRSRYNNNLPSGAFTDPYPFSETFFLASHHAAGVTYERGSEFGLCLLDAWGNSAELYRDPAISSFEPVPLRPRQKPPEVVAAGITDRAGNEKKTGTMFLQDIYQGMTGIERGRVKYVRVMGALEWPWDEVGMSWTLGKDPHRKVIYGVAKVHKDGSAYFTVPAKDNVFFQALDKDYMAVQEMATYINVMPGETRSCVGCHEPRRNAPLVATSRPMALEHPAQALVPQPGDTGVRLVDFTVDIQSIIDQHCITCHSGKSPKGRLDLANVPHNKFSRSYDNLVATDFIRYRNQGVAANKAVPPLTHGARASQFLDMFGKGASASTPGHAKVVLSREEMIRISTWIDANVPYWGSYRGPWQVEQKDSPDFRLLPLPVAMK
ncbi:MAG: hypothetical protein HN383_12355 [Verrucomicrobia bacterium]|nr:hypothetical protein [Verrucomicrobiota bacterium]MBT7700817.1 hypothetical protein [Verrucomicrobiota bacterium]